MKIIFVLVVWFGLSLCSPSKSSPLPEHETINTFPACPKEPAFGIEFTLDHLVSSVTLGNGTTCGLARVHGGSEYQSLMRRYLQRCFDVKGTEAPQLEEMQRAWENGRREEENRRRQLTRLWKQFSWWDYFAVAILRRPEYSPTIFESDEYTGDIDTAILSDAVGMLKNATIHELKNQLNTTEAFPWAHVSFVAPDFFWTTTKPKPDPDMQPNGILTWYPLFTRKFSLALYRNKFRKSGSSKWQEILDSYTSFAGMWPASNAIISYSRYHHCVSVSGHMNPSIELCGSDPWSQMNLAINYDNATLSLWLQGPQADWTPWNTFPDLGGHKMASQTSENVNSSLHLERVISRMEDLSDTIHSTARVDLDVILSGEFWTAESVAALQERFDSDGEDRRFVVRNVLHQLDVFAASKGAARVGRDYLDAWDYPCTLGESDGGTGPDEL